MLAECDRGHGPEQPGLADPALRGKDHRQFLEVLLSISESIMRNWSVFLWLGDALPSV